MKGLTRAAWYGLAICRLALNPPAFFNRLAELPWYGGMLREWTAGLGLTTGARVLEIGCSAGWLSGELAAHGHSVTGVDRSARAIRLAQRSAKARSSPPRFMGADALHLPFEAPVFDATLAASLLNVVPAPEALLAEMMRVTVSGGMVSCLYPTPAMQPDRAHRITEMRGETGFSFAALNLWATRARKLETGTVRQWMERVGLADIREQPLLMGMVSAITGYKPAGL